MAYDEELAERIEDAVAAHGPFTSRKMFGGVCWMVNTNMAVGITHDLLMVRVRKGEETEALSRGAKQMMMGTRLMSGFVTVARSKLDDEDVLADWVARGVEVAKSLPAKPPASASSRIRRNGTT